MDADDLMEQMKFIDSVDVGSSTEVQIFLQSGLDNVVGSTAHNFLQSSVNDILLLSSLEQQFSVELFCRNVSCLLNDIQ